MIHKLLLELLRWWRSSETVANFIWNKANFAAIAIATAKNLTQFHVKFGGCSRLAATATTLLISLTVFALQGCTSGVSGVYKNDNIDQLIRAQIHSQNNKLIRAIINQDITAVKSLLSEKLLEIGPDKIDLLIKQVSTSLKSDSYRTLDEYYIANTSTGINNTLISGTSGDNDYVVNYLALNKEMYTSLIIPSGLDNEILITAIYGKYDNDWKINILQIGQFSVLNKTCAEYHKLAKDCYEKNYLIDAVNYSSVSNQLLQPASTYFHYQKEKEISEFYEKVMAEASLKFSLPMPLENIKGKPKVFKIYPEMIEGEIAPAVLYLTDINLDDTTALKKEYIQVKKEVNSLFKGINKDKKFVLYRALNEIPDGRKKVEHFGFIDRETE